MTARTNAARKAANDALQPGALAMSDLVNRLTQELALAQQQIASSAQKLVSATRSLDTRTQELSEARAALTLLLATLDTSSDGILAVGYFGRAMHFNSRFVEIWDIAADKLEGLNDVALLALQLSQVQDPAAFLAHSQAGKENPDEPRQAVFAMTNGREVECRIVPQRVRGKRLGTVTSYRDVTERERLARVMATLEAQWPTQVAMARAVAHSRT